MINGCRDFPWTKAIVRVMIAFLCAVVIIFGEASAYVYNFEEACESIEFTTNPEKLKIISEKQRKKSFVIKLEDVESGLQFIIKQPEASASQSKFYPINEAIGSYIAQSININTQRVIIVPQNFMNTIKKYKEMPASLHTLVPGESVRNSPYGSKIDIKQYTPSSMQKKKKGITYQIIHDMTSHSDLPCIVALDTFIGMNDRSGSNFFYDKQTDTFWVIDMGSIYKANLCKIACLQMRKMLNDEKFTLTPKECRALKEYGNSIQLLIEKFPPKTLNKLFDIYASQASVQLSEKEISSRKKLVQENYDEAKTFISTLNKLITKQDFQNKITDMHSDVSVHPTLLTTKPGSEGAINLQKSMSSHAHKKR